MGPSPRRRTADLDGKERYECPARAGKAPLRPAQPDSLDPPPRHRPPSSPRPTPTPPPTCCTQRTITVPGDRRQPKHANATTGAARDWITAFTRRSRVEGWFGNLKSNNTEALTRGAFRVMGICKTSLMVAVFAAATNLRLLRAWARRTLGNDDLIPLLTTGEQLPIATEPTTSNWDTGPPHR